jgi:hypothetical protein
MSATPSTLILGKGDTRTRVPIHCDDNGNLYLNVVPAPPGPGGAVPSNTSQLAPTNSLVIALPAVLFSLRVTNPTNADVYLLLFDSVVVPPDGTPPEDYCVIPAVFTGGLDYGDLGRVFNAGVAAVVSTTLNTLTAAGNNHLLSARFKT